MQTEARSRERVEEPVNILLTVWLAARDRNINSTNGNCGNLQIFDEPTNFAK